MRCTSPFLPSPRSRVGRANQVSPSAPSRPSSGFENRFPELKGSPGERVPEASHRKMLDPEGIGPLPRCQPTGHRARSHLSVVLNADLFRSLSIFDFSLSLVAYPSLLRSHGIRPDAQGHPEIFRRHRALTFQLAVRPIDHQPYPPSPPSTTSRGPLWVPPWPSPDGLKPSCRLLPHDPSGAPRPKV